MGLPTLLCLLIHVEGTWSPYSPCPLPCPQGQLQAIHGPQAQHEHRASTSFRCLVSFNFAELSKLCRDYTISTTNDAYKYNNSIM